MYGVVQVGKTEAPFLFLSPQPPPHPHPHPPPPPPPSFTSVVNNKISPSILLIIIILAVIFFVSGLLHLLVRFLFRPSIRDPEELDHVTALQGQLQQLFDLHDSGVDQSFIDTLPVFLYKAIIGIKNPFDCAVCLCEFEADDKLRLLPKCSHAFHVECIDTWLLSHSTCPLCRGTLLPDFFPNSNCSPVVFVLESGSESSREIVADRETAVAATNTTLTQLGVHGEDEFGNSLDENLQKCVEVTVRDDPDQGADSAAKVVQVKLGKFRNVDGIIGGEGSTSSTSNVDGRRCFSMGSYEYVLDDTSSLQVSIKPSTKKQGSKKPSLPLTPGHRQAMSECDCHSSRFQGFDRNGDASIRISGNNTNAKVGKSKRESFSGSKIWLRGKEKTSTGDSSRRALSFRLPLHKTGADESKSKAGANRTTCSDMDVEEWENHGSSEVDCFEEVGNCSSLESHPRSQSFAMRTLLWFVGRHNKVVHSSSSPPV